MSFFIIKKSKKKKGTSGIVIWKNKTMFRKKHSTSQYNPLLYSEARFEGEEFCKDQLLKGYYLIMQVKQNKNIY